jgi:hypothetical protein
VIVTRMSRENRTMNDRTNIETPRDTAEDQYEFGPTHGSPSYPGNDGGRLREPPIRTRRRGMPRSHVAYEVRHVRGSNSNATTHDRRK